MEIWNDNSIGGDDLIGTVTVPAKDVRIRCGDPRWLKVDTGGEVLIQSSCASAAGGGSPTTGLPQSTKKGKADGHAAASSSDTVVHGPTAAAPVDLRQAKAIPGTSSLSVEVLRADGIKDTATFGTQSPYVVAKMKTRSMVADQTKRTKTVDSPPDGALRTYTLDPRVSY